MISLITPVYNAENTLKRAIASVRAQTCGDFEWICVDDGSRDGSRAMLEAAGREDARIRLVSQKNGGAAAARNRGLELAAGEWLAFLDADDWLEPDALEKLLARATESGADVVCCSYTYAYDSGATALPFDPFPDGAVYERAQFPKTVYRRLLTGIQLNHVWHMLYRRDTVRGLRFDTTLKTAEDLLFNVRALTRAGRFAYSAERLFHYYVRADSLTGGSLTWREKARCNRAVQAEMLKCLPEWGMNTPGGRMLVRLRLIVIAISKLTRMLRNKAKG